ncbi:hypothetical protein E2C01_047962 [Portunus trituberculatus]|uniref:Uncharacterized protein n=1 Tax=Portunus trituberculatus TaxID=210409 RepID=A0A5B7GBY9_PORTR|nr:hypothetical protein [Portunus trituberculatus]
MGPRESNFGTVAGLHETVTRKVHETVAWKVHETLTWKGRRRGGERNYSSGQQKNRILSALSYVCPTVPLIQKSQSSVVGGTGMQELLLNLQNGICRGCRGE